MRAKFKAAPVVGLALCAFCLVAPGVLADEQEQKSWLGVVIGGPGQSSSGEGVALRAIVEDGPAAKIGLRARDIVLTVNGEAVGSSRELIRRVQDLDVGSWITVTWERDGEEMEKRVRLGTFPDKRSNMTVRRGWIGVDAIELPPRLREHFGAPEDQGVMISEIVEGSPAEAAGFELGDVVYEIDGDPVGNVAELNSMVQGGGTGNKREFVVARNGAEIILESVIEVAPK